MQTVRQEQYLLNVYIPKNTPLDDFENYEKMEISNRSKK